MQHVGISRSLSPRTLSQLESCSCRCLFQLCLPICKTRRLAQQYVHECSTCALPLSLTQKILPLFRSWSYKRLSQFY